MAVTDLTNTKWLINSDYALTSSDYEFSINFISGNENYTLLEVNGAAYSPSVARGVWYNTTQVWSGGTHWVAEAYRTIEITGGTDVTDAILIAWLEENATQIEEPTQSNYLEIYSNDERATHYKIYANGVLVATLPRVNVTQEGSEITVLNAPATQSGIEVTLG